MRIFSSTGRNRPFLDSPYSQGITLEVLSIGVSHRRSRINSIEESLNVREYCALRALQTTTIPGPNPKSCPDLVGCIGSGLYRVVRQVLHAGTVPGSWRNVE